MLTAQLGNCHFYKIHNNPLINLGCDFFPFNNEGRINSVGGLIMMTSQYYWNSVPQRLQGSVQIKKMSTKARWSKCLSCEVCWTCCATLISCNEWITCKSLKWEQIQAKVMKSFCSVFPNSFPLRTGLCLLGGMQEVQCEIQDFVFFNQVFISFHMY